MRTETEVRELYRQYVYRYAIAFLDRSGTRENQFFGASLALGRALGKTAIQVNADYVKAIRYIERLREEGKELPGFREV